MDLPTFCEFVIFKVSIKGAQNSNFVHSYFSMILLSFIDLVLLTINLVYISTLSNLLFSYVSGVWNVDLLFFKIRNFTISIKWHPQLVETRHFIFLNNIEKLSNSDVCKFERERKRTTKIHINSYSISNCIFFHWSISSSTCLFHLHIK